MKTSAISINIPENNKNNFVIIMYMVTIMYYYINKMSR